MNVAAARSFAFAAVFLLIAVLPVFPAQDPSLSEAPAVKSADVLVLDWDEAWQLALENNEQRKLAIQEREKAHLRVLEAYSSAMPTVDLNGTFNHYFLVPSMIVEFAGETMEFKFSQDNAINANLQLTQPLWLAGKVGIGLRLAKNFQEISELTVETNRQDLKVQVTQAFHGALIADQFVAMTEDALELAGKHRGQARAMFDQGVVSEYDLIRADVAVSNLKPQLYEAEAARDLAYKGLKNLLGLDVDRPVVLEGDLDAAIRKPELSYENASEFAAEKRLELRQLELQKKLYHDEKTIHQRSWLWPNLLAGLRWETQAQSNEWALSEYRFFNGVSGQLILNIPLFDGLAAKRRAETSEVNLRGVELQQQMLQRGIRMQVFQSLRSFELAAEKLEAALENRRQAERGMSIAETRYNNGVGTQLEVLDAQLQLNQARLNVLQAQYDQLVARAQYDRALGEDFDPDRN